MPLAVRVDLRAVAARAHRAPGARVVLRRVEVPPLAVVRAAGLQPAPGAVGHRVRDAHEDPPDRSGDAGRRGLEAHRAVREARREPRPLRRHVENRRAARPPRRRSRCGRAAAAGSPRGRRSQRRRRPASPVLRAQQTALLKPGRERRGSSNASRPGRTSRLLTKSRIRSVSAVIVVSRSREVLTTREPFSHRSLRIGGYVTANMISPVIEAEEAGDVLTSRGHAGAGSRERCRTCGVSRCGACGSRASERVRRADDRAAAVPRGRRPGARQARRTGRAPVPKGRLVIAELDGRIVAALPLDGGPPLRDPFVRTAHLLRLLELRVASSTTCARPKRGLRPRGFRQLRHSASA